MVIFSTRAGPPRRRNARTLINFGTAADAVRPMRYPITETITAVIVPPSTAASGRKLGLLRYRHSGDRRVTNYLQPADRLLARRRKDDAFTAAKMIS